MFTQNLPLSSGWGALFNAVEIYMYCFSLGFGTVYMSLESAAKALAKNLANETVTVVNHK